MERCPGSVVGRPEQAIVDGSYGGLETVREYVIYMAIRDICSMENEHSLVI